MSNDTGRPWALEASKGHYYESTIEIADFGPPVNRAICL